MKKNIKIIFIFLLLLFLMCNYSYAVDEMLQSGDDFISTGEGQASPVQTSNLKGISDKIYNILLSIGVVAAVIVAAYLGIQFMVGGIEAQAKVKESLIPFVIGCIAMFGAFGIWKAVATILQNV